VDPVISPCEVARGMGLPLPLIEYVFSGMSALLLVGLLYTILNAMFRSAPWKIGGNYISTFRAYIRQGAQFIPHHWVCPECGGFSRDV